MALISFFSAKGAPGTTSTAMLVAALWPRPTLLVDADPAGGDVLMRLPTEAGIALTQRPGLLTLLPLARHGLAPGVVMDHSQVAQGGQRLLVGLDSPEQAEASAALWPTLARTFDELPGADVIIDLGQLSARSSQLALAERSDMVVGVIRPTPASVMHMRQRLTALTRTLSTLGADAPLVGLVAIADVQQQGEASSALATVLTDVPGVHHLGMIAHEPRAERMFHGDLMVRPERTMLVRSGRTLVQRLVAQLGDPGGAATDSAADPAAAAAAAATDAPAGGEGEPHTHQKSPDSSTPQADATVSEEPATRRERRKKWRVRR